MKVIRGAMLFLDLTSFFISYLLVLEMLISDHILPVFLIVSPNRTIRSGFGNYPPKTCGTTQPVLHFDHFQTSWCLPCPAKVKEQQGEKVPVCSLYPRPLHHQGLRFSALGSPWPWGTGPAFPGSGEKLEDPRKRKKKNPSLILFWANGDTKIWEKERLRIRNGMKQPRAEGNPWSRWCSGSHISRRCFLTSVS